MLISELGASASDQGCCHASNRLFFSFPALHEAGLPGMVAARLGIGGHLKAVYSTVRSRFCGMDDEPQYPDS